MKIVVALALILVAATPVVAQQVDIRAPAPRPEERPPFIAPGPNPDLTEPRENQWYPGGVRVPFDPAFIYPMSEEYETTTTRGRYGIAGWTAQNLPVAASGTQYRDREGWLVFGFAFTWGAAPKPARPATTPRPAAVPAR